MAGGLPGSGEAHQLFAVSPCAWSLILHYLYGSGAVWMERRKNFKPIFSMLPFGRSGLGIVTNAPSCLVRSEQNVTNRTGQRMYLHF